jgi:hypothetical protein
MMQSITWKKFSLFALRLKTKKNYILYYIIYIFVEQEKIPNLFEVRNINLFEHEIEMWITLNAIWIELNSGTLKGIWIQPNSIFKNGMHIDGKYIQNLPMNMELGIF